MYSPSTPNMRLKLNPAPPTPLKEFPTNEATSPRPIPSPTPVLKVKRLKFDCAEADAAIKQKTIRHKINNIQIRFTNLYLLFWGSGSVCENPYRQGHEGTRRKILKRKSFVILCVLGGSFFFSMLLR